MAKANKKFNTGQIKKKKNDFLIVGIGASAGGIQALQLFFKNVPADSGMAYVVILHLSPDHDSQLAQVLQASAAIPVSQVNEKVLVKPDQIYVVSPNQHLSMADGEIVVSQNITTEDRRAPVDIFFRTLADSHGPKAVCVVLSGSGANGSMGLKRIKEMGGVAFVQNPREADFSEMPRNSIATELVDEVLPVAEIPAKIIEYRNGINRIHIPIETVEKAEEEQQALRELFTQLRLRTGHDFSNYKRPTLLRRIERRINIRSFKNLPTYVAFLKDNPEEVQSLLKDLLISVTNFFRDSRPFQAIENDVIPKILHNKNSEYQVRVWIAGCATGEEAYSIAILFAEKIMGIIDAPKIQIFATDIDENAIAIAREGLYTINDAADVSPDRLRRYFNKEGEDYRIRREIREMVLFATHNFLKDPPFSHLDMVTCRNVMIYLNHVAQERALETFHFALKPGGFLFLGTSESVEGTSDMYAAYNREQHIYQNREITMRSFPVPESVPNFRLDNLKPSGSQEQERKALERITLGDLHQRMLEEYAPPSLVINEDHEIVHLSRKAGKYLQVAGGEFSHSLLKLVKEELRQELRSAIYQAAQLLAPVLAKGIRVNFEGHIETINIHVRPVMRHDDTARGFMLVLFEQNDDQEGNYKELVVQTGESISHQLEDELERTRMQLRSSSEQYEFQAEELKASNEELQAMNEELRSAAEELETSKEELQSINEELRTVNQELKIKIDEATISANNLQNLINASDVATLFLDRTFRVIFFTPAATSIFNLIVTDYGRPLSDITNKLKEDVLLQNAENVLQNLAGLEQEVSTRDGQYFVMRMVPYRTREDFINGIVITFFDITERKKAQQSVEEDLNASRILQNLSSRLVSEENINIIYEEIIAAAIDITNADAGIVQVYDSAEQELKLLATRGFSDETKLHFSKIDASSNTSSGIAIQKGERQFIDYDDLKADDKDASSKIHVAEGYLTGQSTQLTTRSGKTIGLISTYWKQHSHRSSERALRYLDLLARQAADIIDQRLAARELLKNMEELTRFNSVMVSRELKMIELKKEINDLFKRAGEPPRYPLDFENEK